MKYADRAKETTTTTGTGNITLAGAVSQFQSLNSAIGVGIWFDYAIVGQTGTEWETGVGILSGSTTLVRSYPKEGSSGDNTLVSFAAGTKDVFNTISGFTKNADLGRSLALATGQAWV